MCVRVRVRVCVCARARARARVRLRVHVCVCVCGHRCHLDTNTGQSCVCLQADVQTCHRTIDTASRTLFARLRRKLNPPLSADCVEC